MAVSNYSGSTNGCKYSYNKLKDVLYLVSSEHVKDIKIDNGEAYISGLTELPLRINGFNIQFKEETSFDERYKFQKTITLSMHGYVNYRIFGGRYYAIVESQDGTFFMINVDFPSRVTHTFNLSKDINQTDFTFSSLSNFPTLKLNAEFEAESPVCFGFNVHGIDKLELIEKEKVRLDVANRSVIATESFKTIEYLGNSCSFQETYDGFNVTDTISFDIAFDNYKPSWQYNLLEFLDNKYSAIITPKGGDNKYYPGYNFGLQPSYTIQTASQEGQSDIITVTLTETSPYGATAAIDWSEGQTTATRWRYVKKVNDIICYECVGLGQAKYLVKQEVDAFGNPTDNYQVLQGYTSQYPMFNIVGTFSQVQLFANSQCAEGELCDMESTIPSRIEFTSATCKTYTIKTSCDWTITNDTSNITVSPTSGVAGTQYTLTVCNSVSAPSIPIENYFAINCCNGRSIINCVVTKELGCVKSQTQRITCLAQNTTFRYDGVCNLTVSSNPSGLTYFQSNNVLSVQVPANTGATERTFTLVVRNCGCNASATTLTINQDRVYERWVDESDYLCISGNSYMLQRRYTGVTSGNVTTRTDETRPGELITSGDTRCDVTYKWEWDGAYYCVDGNKIQCIEESVTTDGGATWKKTGKTRLGDMTESASTWCNTPVTYSWVLTDESQCGERPLKLSVIYSDLSTYYVECNDLYTLYTVEVAGGPLTKALITAVTIGNCVTSIGDGAFSGCTSLPSITIPNGVTSIGERSFYRCGILSSVTIPNSVESIGVNAFRDCNSLTSVTIPNSVESIGGYAFYMCSGLTSVTIGSGITSIEERAFRGCTGLTGITIYATTPPTLGTFALDNTNNCPIYVPSASVNTYKSATGWSTYSSRIQAITN